MRISDTVGFFESNPDITHLDAIFMDVNGMPRGKRLDRLDAEAIWKAGLTIPLSVHGLDVTGHCPDALGRGFSDGDPDGVARPIDGTLFRKGWSTDAGAAVLMQVESPPSAAFAMDPRVILSRLAAAFHADTGYRTAQAVELEFYLVDGSRDASGYPQPPVSPLTGKPELTGQTYGLDDLDTFSKFLVQIRQACKAAGIPASCATKEYSPGQFEINLRHQDNICSAADHGVLLRHIVRCVARDHGFQATFMAKPYSERAGSGMHLHISLLDGSGRNLFDDGSDLGTDFLRRAIGGLQATTSESMAFFAPNLNSYRRFAPNRFVPVNRSWGYNNRSVALRVPAGSCSARRIEHRMAGADANPYLALAAVLAGIWHGLSKDLQADKASFGNACVSSDPSLPMDLPTAVAALSTARALPAMIDPGYLCFYSALKRSEYERFISNISMLEYEWYL